MFKHFKRELKEFNKLYEDLLDIINRNIESSIKKNEPVNLYSPMKYMVNLRGKRLRPILLMLSCDALGGDYRNCISAACAVEIIHNFTLVHDDIMDEDDKRRGEPTVYKKWNRNVAILTGDGLIALAYKFLSDVPAEKIKEIIKIFSDGIIKICEGQSMDNDFEKMDYVSEKDYLKMVSLKTGVLLSVCAEIGAILANANPDEVTVLKKFGMELGIAFQIQDDLFDIYSSEEVLSLIHI